MGVAVFPAAGGGVTQKVQDFTSTGTFTVPSNCSSVQVFVVAGGGAGGGARALSGDSNSAIAGGGGGGGGIVREEIVSVTPGTSYTVTVGAGGSGAAGNANSTAGTNSSFGSLVVAHGGGAGVSMEAYRTVGNTFFRTNLTGGTVGGDAQSLSTSSNGCGHGGGAGSSPYSLFETYNGNIGSYSGFNGYDQPIPTQGFSGIGTTNNNIYFAAGRGIGIYGWGGVGASAYTNSVASGTAGSPSWGILEQKTMPYLRPGGNGTANTGSAGAGSAATGNNVSTGNSNGGNGGSGFVRVIYWS